MVVPRIKNHGRLVPSVAFQAEVALRDVVLILILCFLFVHQGNFILVGFGCVDRFLDLQFLRLLDDVL